MSGIDHWQCNKHQATGPGPSGCPECHSESVGRVMGLFSEMSAICEPCTVKNGKIRFLESCLAAAESARDAAEAAYSACKASLDRQTAIADECAEEAQKYLAERDAALAVLRDMVAKWAPHSGLCCRYIDGQIVVCADSCACEELHREARELCGMEPYAPARG
jgi:hypothetical protein